MLRPEWLPFERIGCASVNFAIANAVDDAISEYGVKLLELPITPERVYSLIKARETSKIITP